jgi:hypothetical protein
MDIVWLTVKMLIYGFLIGMIILLGAIAYAFITIHFEKKRCGEGLNLSLHDGVNTSSGQRVS